jgi:3-hydroxyisobutyrate dehydrogenase-like beta-hydroxyacid dehydrogenase
MGDGAQAGVEAVGIVGTGAMGAAMWARLRDEGIAASVFDIDPATTARLAGEGATVHDSPAALAAACRTVLLSLPRSSDVERVTLGDGGVAEAGPGTVVLDTTSGVPSASRAIGTALAERGVSYADVGVTGGVDGARAGTLMMLAGGPDDVLDAATPLLEHLARRVVRCGDVGAGHTMKTLLNQANQTKLIAELEALIVATKVGLDPKVAADVLGLNVWQTWLLGDEGRRSFGFTLGLANKDFDVAMQLAADAGVAVPVAAAGHQSMRVARAVAGADADLVEEVAVWERFAGVEIRPA